MASFTRVLFQINVFIIGDLFFLTLDSLNTSKSIPVLSKEKNIVNLKEVQNIFITEIIKTSNFTYVVTLLVNDNSSDFLFCLEKNIEFILEVRRT